MASRFLYSLVLCIALSAGANAQCTTTTLSGNQVISTNTTWNAGTYNIAGDFTVNTGVTLTISNNSACPFTVNATNINILGTIVADGTGNAGGTGGSGGASSGGAGGGANAAGGSGGNIGSGTGAGTPGTTGGNASSGCSIDCGTACIGGNDADRAGGGGGSGGSGGSYGNTGGTGGGGAAGRIENEPSNSRCGSTPVAGGGASGNAALPGYGNAADNSDLVTGSGGGGGGGGGGGFAAGTTGGNGGNGGGAVNLNATNNLVVSGTISANGANGAAGGNGGVRSGNTGDWNCTACSNSNGGGANSCRDASACGNCTYYTWGWPGGAGGGAGGGSGGGIKLQAEGVFSITGSLLAKGGNGGNAGRPWTSLDGNCNNYALGGGAGAGGVIKYVYNPCLNNTFSPVTLSANAGTAGLGSDGNGSPGNANNGVVFDENSNITFAGYASITTPLITASQTICAGATPATLNAIITGGSGPFAYQWYLGSSPSGQTGSNSFPAPGYTAINGATADSLPSSVIGATNSVKYFQVLVSTGNCVQWSRVVTITVTPSPKIDSVKLSNILCNGAGNGAITVYASSGTSPYNYSIDSGVTTQATNTFSNLSGGLYTVFVSDANGCSKAYASNPVTVHEPAPVVQTDSTVNATCLYVSNGAIIVHVAGGSNPYQYTVNGGAYQSSNSFTNIAAGVYYVNVKDSNGCTSGAQVVSVGNTDTLTGSVLAQNNVTCNGYNNGVVTVAVTGGTSPYSYSVDNGTAQTTQTFTGLSATSHSITFSDVNGCSTSIAAQITQPAELRVLIDTVINVSCGIANSGQVFTHVDGGTSPYTYLWNNAGSTANISGLALGTYKLLLTDSNGCVDSASATVGFDSSLLLNITANAPRCFGDDGGASVTLNNGTAPFRFNWSNGDTTAVVTNLTLGSSTVSVTDANNCSATQTLITSQPSQLIISVDSVQPACNSATGSASATTTGGNGPYIYIWSNGGNTDTTNFLAPGSYTVTAYDSHNCTAAISFSVSNQSGLDATATTVADSCNGASNGSAQVAVVGGTSPFVYNWSNGSTTSSVSGLPAGNYLVTVTDSTGCSITKNVAVTQPAPIHTVTSSTGASAGQNNGTATLDSITGGTGSYSQVWSNSQTGVTATNLAVGSYTVTITDGNGCTQTATVIVPLATGISTVTGGIELNIYPNPANNELSVDLGEISNTTTLSVRNALGQQVIYKTLNAAHNAIDISKLGSGVYTLEVKQGDSIVVKEVVVSK